ncbi:aldehyde dehydrogenase family protein [Candidatus Peregrinibacteria bacterium]|nr:aldehyde dehydrogenase family protein [Candidatus Peregrinibacteria bacterium]
MNDYKIYNAGKFISTTKILEVTNPYDASVVAKTYQAGQQELEEAITAAEKVQKEMQKLPSYKRYEILMQIADGLTKDRKRLGKVLAQESGKPLIYAQGEIDRAAQTFVVAAEEAKRLPSEYMSLDWTASGKGKEGIVKYFPVGLVAGIAPFNFPLNLAVHKVAPAIAAGCPIILKPASSTPLSTLELAKIIDKTDLPKGAVSIIPMDRESGNQLVTDERFKLLSFTGSPVVGWEMKKHAGKKKVVLELGGNAGVIVTETANMDKAIKQSLIGAFSYSGQVCIHAQRIYVQKSAFNTFVEEFTEATKGLKFGDPCDKNTDVSSMIDEKNAMRIESWVNEAVKDGAKVLYGGERKGTFYTPTILSNTTLDMKVCSLEAFGPIVVIEPFDTFQEAIDMVNTSVFGLQAGVFTNSLKEMKYAHEELEVGGVVINDIPTFRVDHMPYGGVKDSGLGREGVKYAMHDMLEPRILIIDNN